MLPPFPHRRSLKPGRAPTWNHLGAQPQHLRSAQAQCPLVTPPAALPRQTPAATSQRGRGPLAQMPAPRRLPTPAVTVASVTKCIRMQCRGSWPSKVPQSRPLHKPRL
eukprot:scaffold109132_cov15-Tisochrysis_lutea.AAC.2